MQLCPQDAALLARYRLALHTPDTGYLVGLLQKMAWVLHVHRPQGIGTLAELCGAGPGPLREAIDSFRAFAAGPLPHPAHLRFALDSLRAMACGAAAAA